MKTLTSQDYTHVAIAVLPYRWCHLVCVKEVDGCCSQLVPRLSKLPVDVIGSRLTKLLLSRLVIINSTASSHLLPYLLTPASGLLTHCLLVPQFLS